MGKRDKVRIQAIKAGRRRPFREEQAQSRDTAEAIMSQIPTNRRLHELGLVSVRRKLPKLTALSLL